MIQPFELLDEAVTRGPNDIGLVSPTGSITFSQMREISRSLAKNFSNRGVKPRQIVSTFLPPDQDWLSTLAIFHEAAVPVSLWGIGTISKLNVSWFVSNEPSEGVSSQQTILIQKSFDEDRSDSADHQRTLFARPDKPMRCVLTSGTTGAPKAVIFTADNIESRLGHLASYWADNRPELNFMGLSTTGGFFTALAGLQHGYPYMAEIAVNLSALERAKEYGIQVLAGSPAQIGQALKLIREHKLQLPNLVEVRVAGSLPSQKLVSAIHDELDVQVKSVYGSTEGGGVAVTTLKPGDNTSDVGVLVPGIQLEIQQQDGVSGQIRYRGPGVSPGYLEGPDSESSFVDGWFYPGDTGFISEQNHLILHGRSDELMNFGGTKINPEKVEEQAKEFQGVIDAGVCLIEQLPGIEEVAIAVVGENGIDLRALDRFLRAKVPVGHPTVFTTSTQIPRNLMGKTVRVEVKNQILRNLNRN
jgi:acyl-coenzyme A synthetase/AMP-(fatty) acid ligase